MPFSLDVEPPPPDLRARAEALAQAARLPAAVWDRPISTLDGDARARVRVARALALDPEVLLLEHPTATVDRRQVALLGRDIRMAIEARGAAALTLTADEDFAAAAAGRVAVLDPASGRLIPRRRRGWFVRN
jgi:alpha-D-ribose 1-methylphosphonate 5-triphosphate synthase subunit PhnL